MVTQKSQFILSLLKLGIGTESVHDSQGTVNDSVKDLLQLSWQKWQEVMALAERQGVLAIAVDGLQVLMEAHRGEILAVKENPEEWQMWLLENIGQLTQYETLNHQQRKVIAELSEMWAAEGIRMMVFKGQANAALYPKPEHRAVGDIDCWLFGDAEKGDDIAKAQGAEVSFEWYRHSKISFHDETIENHRVMSHTRGNRKKQEMERELRKLAKPHTDNSFIGKAMRPSAQFNACFLTYHGLHHFTSEGLRMKQILDWAMFLQKEQDMVDWDDYWEFCKRYKLERFAAVMNMIATEQLGVVFHTNSQDLRNERARLEFTDSTEMEMLAEKVLLSTLYDDDYLFNSGKSDWTVRWLLVKNMLTRNRWKYRDVAQESVLKHMWQSTMGFLIQIVPQKEMKIF